MTGKRVPAALAMATMAVVLSAMSGPAAGDEDDERKWLEERFESVERKITAERQRLLETLAEREQQLELVRRFLPSSFDGDAERRVLGEMAEAAGLDDLRVQVAPTAERLNLPDGTASPIELYRIDLAGRASYDTVHWFLSRTSVRPRAVALEHLRLSVEPDSTVDLEARLGLPVYAPVDAPEPPPRPAPTVSFDGQSPLERHYAAREAVLQAHVAELRDRARRTQATLEIALDLAQGSKGDRVTNAIAALAREAGQHAIALTHVQVDGGEIVIDGVVQGAAARARLRPALGGARFRVEDLDVTPDGDCHAFTARTVLPRPDDPLADTFEPSVARNGLFEGRTAAACDPEPQPPLGRASTQRGAAVPDENAFLVLRDVDAADVVRILHDALGVAFVLDPDVTGRMDVDVHAEASLDDVWRALRSVGLAVGPDPIRRVARTGALLEPLTASRSGEPVSLMFREADLRQVLCLFGRLSGRPMRVAPEVEGTVTVFAADRPWDEILDAIAAARGMTASIGEAELFVGPASAERPSEDACAGSTSRPRPSWPTFTTTDVIGPEDLALVGRSVLQGEWTAHAYGPGRAYWPVRPGLELFGATVTAVGPAGVEIRSADGATSVMPFPR